jgi:hypothetical protein
MCAPRYHVPAKSTYRKSRRERRARERRGAGERGRLPALCARGRLSCMARRVVAGRCTFIVLSLTDFSHLGGGGGTLNPTGRRDLRGALSVSPLSTGGEQEKERGIE